MTSLNRKVHVKNSVCEWRVYIVKFMVKTQSVNDEFKSWTSWMVKTQSTDDEFRS